MEKVRIKQVRSAIGRNPRVNGTLKALGLGKTGKSREVVLADAVKGMVKKVEYLLEITPAK